MRRPRIRRPRIRRPHFRAGSFANVTAVTALVISLGGTSAYAATLITSKQIKNNTIKSIDVRDGNLTGTDIADGSVGGADLGDGSVSGTDVGDNALTGADVQDFSLTNQDVGVLFAQINADGTVANSSGGVTASQPFGTGTYAVDFGRDISNCAFTASVGDADAGGTTGSAVQVTDRSGNAEAVFVRTRGADGATDTNKPFQLIVVC
jgi:hypothetical protein